MSAELEPVTPALLESILEVEEVCKSFDRTAVLAGVSITIKAGEFFTLLGPSGCGKTTLLRIIAGLETPDSGRLKLLGTDALALPAHRRPVNTVFQSYALFPHLNVWDNVAFGLRMKKIAAGELRERVERALHWVRASELATRTPAQLSGGQKQRVALARAIVNEPKILLLDEPLAALDLKLRQQLQEELRELQRALAMTFIYVTHDQDEAFSLSDRIAVLHEGRLEQVGTPQELYSRPRNRFVAQFLGGCNLIEGIRRGQAVETSFGILPLPSTSTSTSTKSSDGGSECWGIRPEHVVASIAASPPAAQGSFQGTLEEIRFFGSELRCIVRAGDQALRLRLPSASPLSTSRSGDSVWIHFPQEHLRFLDR